MLRGGFLLQDRQTPESQLVTHLRSNKVTWPGGWAGRPKMTTYSLRMSSSVNGTSSISTADLAVKKIPNIAWKRAEQRCSTRGPGNKRRPQGETPTCGVSSTPQKKPLKLDDTEPDTREGTRYGKTIIRRFKIEQIKNWSPTITSYDHMIAKLDNQLP